MHNRGLGKEGDGLTENEFIKERQKVLKSMSDTVCLTREEAKYILEEIEQYRAIGTFEECREAMEVKHKITEIVNKQLIVGNGKYKEVYGCFYDIVKSFKIIID